MNEAEIEDLLRTLGISRSYKGYRRIVYILGLALEDEDRLEAVTKELYMEAADTMGCSWGAVEHSLRTVIKRGWTVNPGFMEKMAGYPMDGQPMTSEFLSMALGYIQRRSSSFKRPS